MVTLVGQPADKVHITNNCQYDTNITVIIKVIIKLELEAIKLTQLTYHSLLLEMTRHESNTEVAHNRNIAFRHKVDSFALIQADMLFISHTVVLTLFCLTTVEK